jgi:transcription elongation GreA/GreB family factor
MNATESKQKLHNRCIAVVDKRIADAKQAMDDAQESANQEDKSSAGDKYETGRAMAQIARDQAAQQLDEALKLKNTLDQINTILSSNKIGLGSLVITDSSRFYISVSIGKLEVDGKEYFAISPQSPIGKLLFNLNVGDTLSFQGRSQKIRDVR